MPKKALTCGFAIKVEVKLGGSSAEMVYLFTLTESVILLVTVFLNLKLTIIKVY